MKKHLTSPASPARRGLLLSAMSFAALSGCSVPDPIGRVDRRPTEGGIGGTGIVGLVTGFGSLLVNGRKVETTGGTVYSTALGFTRPEAVALGDSLTVEAETRGNGLFAKRVHITHPLIGTVQSVARNGASLVLNGVTVILERQVRGLASPGDRLRISGVWRGTNVVASRLATDLSGIDVVAGDVGRTNENMTIGGVAISNSARRPTLKTDEFATAIGRYSEGELIATKVTAGRFIGATRPIEQLSVEGYLKPVSQQPGYAVAGLGHSFSEGLSLRPFRAGRTLFEGPYIGTFDASQALRLPSAFPTRARLFNTLTSGQQTGKWKPTR